MAHSLSLKQVTTTQTLVLQMCSYILPCFLTGMNLIFFPSGAIFADFLLFSLNSLSHVHTSLVIGKLPYLFLFSETLARVPSMQVESLFFLTVAI